MCLSDLATKCLTVSPLAARLATVSQGMEL